MHHEEFEPPESLRDTIKCFWYNRRDFGVEESSFEVMPDGYAEIIFHFGSPCIILGNGEMRPLVSPFVMGLLNHPMIISTKGRFEIIGIRCFPWTLFDLLGLPSGKDAVHMLAHPVAQLQPKLAALISVGRVEAALAAVVQYFLSARSQVTIDSTLSKAGSASRSQAT